MTNLLQAGCCRCNISYFSFVYDTVVFFSRVISSTIIRFTMLCERPLKIHCRSTTKQCTRGLLPVVDGFYKSYHREPSIRYCCVAAIAILDWSLPIHKWVRSTVVVL